jgi:hypothetical protein
MISMTWTSASADLSCAGGTAVRPYPASVGGLTLPADVAMVAPTVAFQGTGAPVDGIAVRLREDFRPTGMQQLSHNSIGADDDATPLGLRTPGRPPS